MKNILSGTALLPVLASTLVACSGAAQAQQYELVWSDEFEGTSLDTSSWSYQIGNGSNDGLPSGWGNNELQYYTSSPSNIVVNDGKLKITALRQSNQGSSYTSARIRTKGKREFLYGRFEASMKLPSTSGVWPAFWMLPSNSPYGGWASSGEIDIMESVNEATLMYGTIHHGAPWPNNQHSGGTYSNGIDFSQDFHVFAMEWEPDQIRWYVDGNLYYTRNSNQWYSSVAQGNNRAPFDVPFHLLLNVAVGGNFPGNPNGSASFPQTMEVEYVRVYQQLQQPFGGGGAAAIPGLIQAEDFDIGGEGRSYQDCDATNNGGDYRETGVDIEESTEGGYNIGWICEGEWIEYSVDVAEAGPYRIDARVASETTGGAFHIEVNDANLTGPIEFGATGGWQNWETATGTLELEAGPQIIRFVNDGLAADGYNFNSMEFTYAGPCSPADFAPGYGEIDFLDISAFLGLYSTGNLGADLTGDGELDFLDLSIFIGSYTQGCP